MEYDLTLDEAMPLMERGAKLTARAAAGLGLPDELKAMIDATPDVVCQRRDWAIWVWSKLACARSLSPPRLASVGSHTAPPAFFGRCFMEW
jgi:hypothetical protein